MGSSIVIWWRSNKSKCRSRRFGIFKKMLTKNIYYLSLINIWHKLRTIICQSIYDVMLRKVMNVVIYWNLVSLYWHEKRCTSIGFSLTDFVTFSAKRFRILVLNALQLRILFCLLNIFGLESHWWVVCRRNARLALKTNFSLVFRMSSMRFWVRNIAVVIK